MMYGSIGVPEILLILLSVVLTVVPIVATVWAVVTLQRIRNGQHAMLDRLTAIEQALQRR